MKCELPGCEKEVHSDRSDHGIFTCMDSHERKLEQLRKTKDYTCPELEEYAAMTRKEFDGFAYREPTPQHLLKYRRSFWFHGDKVPPSKHGLWLSPERVSSCTTTTTSTTTEGA